MKINLKEYRQKFKKYKEEYWQKTKVYIVKNKIQGMISSKDHPAFFKYGETWEKRRARLDKPILKTARFKKGDVLKYSAGTKDFGKGKKIRITAVVEDIKTCESGTGRIMYSFKNPEPYYKCDCIYYYDNESNNLKFIRKELISTTRIYNNI